MDNRPRKTKRRQKIKNLRKEEGQGWSFILLEYEEYMQEEIVTATLMRIPENGIGIERYNEEEKKWITHEYWMLFNFQGDSKEKIRKKLWREYRMLRRYKNVSNLQK